MRTFKVLFTLLNLISLGQSGAFWGQSCKKEDSVSASEICKIICSEKRLNSTFSPTESECTCANNTISSCSGATDSQCMRFTFSKDAWQLAGVQLELESNIVQTGTNVTYTLLITNNKQKRSSGEIKPNLYFLINKTLLPFSLRRITDSEFVIDLATQNERKSYIINVILLSHNQQISLKCWSVRVTTLPVLIINNGYDIPKSLVVATNLTCITFSLKTGIGFDKVAVTSDGIINGGGEDKLENLPKIINYKTMFTKAGTFSFNITVYNNYSRHVWFRRDFVYSSLDVIDYLCSDNHTGYLGAETLLKLMVNVPPHKVDGFIWKFEAENKTIETRVAEIKININSTGKLKEEWYPFSVTAYNNISSYSYSPERALKLKPYINSVSVVSTQKIVLQDSWVNFTCVVNAVKVPWALMYYFKWNLEVNGHSLISFDANPKTYHAHASGEISVRCSVKRSSVERSGEKPKYGYTTVLVVKKVRPFLLRYAPFRVGQETEFHAEFDIAQYRYPNFPEVKLFFKWNFGDGCRENVTDSLTTKHLYKQRGKYTAWLTVSNNLNEYTQSVNVFVNTQPCDLEVYFPQEWQPAIKYTTAERVILRPRIVTHCPSATTINYLWKCNTTTPLLNFEFPGRLLNVTSGKLGIGLSNCSFEVTLKNKSIRRNYTVFLQVKRTPVKPIIKTDGQVFLNRSDESAQKVTLDFSHSYDPDLEDNTPLRFNWECYSDGSYECFKPNHQPASKDSRNISFYPYHINRDINKILIVLTVSKEGRKPAHTTHLYRVDGREDNSLPLKYQAHLTCDSCKRTGFSAQSKWKFSLSIPDLKPEDQVLYKWIILVVSDVNDRSPLYVNYGKCMPNHSPENAQALTSSNYTTQKKPKKYTTPSLSNHTRPTRGDAKCKIGTLRYCSNNFRITNNKVASWHNSSVKVRRSLDVVGFAANEKDLPERQITFANNSNNFIKATTPTYTKERKPKQMPSTVPIVTQKPLKLKDNTKYKNYFYARHNYKEWTKGERVLHKNYMLLQPGGLVPDHEYEVICKVTGSGKTLISQSNTYFRTEPVPMRGRCSLDRSNGTEMETVFTMSCQMWKSKRDLIYTLSAVNEKKEEISLLHSNVHMFSFLLSSHDLFNSTTGEIQVTIHNDRGEWIYLCPMEITLKRNETDNSSLLKMFKEYENKTFIAAPNFELQKLTVILKQLNRNTNDSYNLREAICRILPSFYNQVPDVMIIKTFAILTETTKQLSATCTMRISDRLEKIIEMSTENFLLYQNQPFLPFLNHSFHIVTNLFQSLKTNFYMDKSTNITVIKCLYRCQKKLFENSKRQYYLHNNFVYTDSNFWALGDSQRSGQKSGSLGEIYKYIPKILENKDECFEWDVIQFQNGFNWLDKNLHDLMDITYNRCKSPATNILGNATKPAFTIRFPVQSHTTKGHKLKWDVINVHEYTCSHNPLRTYHMFVNILSYKSIYGHFKILLKLRFRSSNKTHAIAQLYPNDFNQFQYYTLFTSADIDKASGFNVSLEIVSAHHLYRKIVEKPGFSYTINITTSHCRHWRVTKDNEFKSTNSCVTSDQSTDSKLVCRCTEEGLIGGYNLPLEARHHEQHPTERRVQSITILEVLGVVLLIFITLIIFSLYSYAGLPALNTVIELPENHPCDVYKYDVLVETGHNFGAGTTAKVCAVLHGSLGHSQKFEMTCEQRFMFQRTCTDVITVRCPQNLGELTHLVVWHDNRGPSPDWYLKQIVVQAPHNRMFFFPLYNWLSAGRGTKKNHAKLVATDQCCSSKTQVFLEGCVDFNVWLSVFLGPAISSYSLTKRLAYLLTKILFFSSTSIVVFYKQINKNSTLTNLLHFQQANAALTPLLTVLLFIPISLVISCFYRNATKLHVKTKHLLKRKRNKIAPDSRRGTLVSEDKISFYSNSIPASQNYDGGWSLPYRFQYCASFILLAVFSLSTAAICWAALREEILGFELAWLQFILVAILWDILLISPITSGFEAMMFAIVCSRQGYYERLLKTSEALKTKCSHQNEASRVISVRHRARFIRYANPVSPRANRCKKQFKDYIVKKQSRKIFKSLLLVTLAAALISFIEIESSYEINQSIRESLNLESLLSPMKTTDRNATSEFYGSVNNTNSYKSCNITSDGNITNHCENTTQQNIIYKDDIFWEWALKEMPGIISNNEWHTPFNDSKITVSQSPFKVLGPSILQTNNNLYILQGQRKDVRKLLKSIKNETTLGNNIVFKFNLVTNLSNKSILSMTELNIERIAGKFVHSFSVHSVTMENENEMIIHTSRQIYIQLLLVMLTAWCLLSVYDVTMQRGLAILLTTKKLFNCLSVLVSLLCIIMSASYSASLYSLQSAFDLVEFSAHSLTQATFIDMSTCVCLNKGVYISYGLLLLLACVKVALLMKLIERVRPVFSMLKRSFTPVASYTVHVTILIVACSHFLYLYGATRSRATLTYAHTMQHFIQVTLLKARAEGHTLYSQTLLAFVCYLAIKMSVVFFLGNFKRKTKSKLVTIEWILKKSYKYYRKRMKKLFNGKSKENKGSFSSIPKKYIYTEIDYQLEEIIYRINRIAETDFPDLLLDNFSRQQSSGWEYSQSNCSSSVVTSEDDVIVSRDNFSNARNASYYSTYNETLTSDKIASILSDSVQMKVALQKIREEKVLERSDSRRRIDSPSFKRFPLDIIAERNDTIEPIRSATFNRFILPEPKGKINECVEMKPMGKIPHNVTEKSREDFQDKLRNYGITGDKDHKQDTCLDLGQTNRGFEDYIFRKNRYSTRLPACMNEKSQRDSTFVVDVKPMGMDNPVFVADENNLETSIFPTNTESIGHDNRPAKFERFELNAQQQPTSIDEIDRARGEKMRAICDRKKSMTHEESMRRLYEIEHTDRLENWFLNRTRLMDRVESRPTDSGVGSTKQSSA